MRLFTTILVFLFLSHTMYADSTNVSASQNKTFTERDSLELITRVALQKFDYYTALKSRLALQNLLESKDKDQFEKSKLELAHIYFKLGYYNESSDMAQEALDYANSILDKESIIKSNLILSRMEFEQSHFEKAVEFLEESERNGVKKIKTPDRIDYLILSAYSNLYLGDTLKANILLDEANEFCLSMDQPNYYAELQLIKGHIANATGKTKEATTAYLKSKKVSKQLNNMYRYNEALGLLIKQTEKSKNFDSAYGMLTEYSRIKDSLTDQKRSETISNLIIKYGSKVKQKEIIDLEGEKRVTELKSRRGDLATYALLISFIAVLAAAYLIINFYQQKLSSNQIILAQKEQINQQKIKELNNNLQIQSMQSMMKGQELERERVAKDLHDSLGGMLSTIKLKYDSLIGDEKEEEFEHITSMLDDACQEVRNISSNLQPGALEQLGLVEAVNDLINKYDRRTSTEIDFQHYGMTRSRLDTFISLNIYRIIQELLNNSIKHAGSKEILVQINRNRNELMVMVEDDGKGYDSTKVDEGMGSENIRSRVNFLKGEINIQSAEGEGTSTLITLPI